MQHKSRWVTMLAVTLFGILIFVMGRDFPVKEFQKGETERHSEFQNSTKSSPGVLSADSQISLPLESSDSNDPAERAIANGTVLDTQTHFLASDRHLTRIRLVKTGVQPRPLRVVERWEVRDGRGTLQSRGMFLADQLLVRVEEGVDRTALQQALESSRISVIDEIAPGLFTLRLPSVEINGIPQALEALAARPDVVKSAEADGVGFGGGIPNDPEFVNQWALNNTNQFLFLYPSVLGIDVDAPEFWDVVGGAPGLVIAVLDTGLNFTHPDLQNVAWVNPGEVAGNGIDDDGNGRVDDINGWDFVNNDSNPTDDNGHGSHVSGIIVANRNNGIGIAGLLPEAKVMVVKVLNSSNSGLTSNLIAGLAYARSKGVKLMNLSLQNYSPFSALLNAEVTACETAGILLVISAGNNGTNNDTTPNYPSSLTQTNILAVGNHALDNTRWPTSNFGQTSVDIFAPGRFIGSTNHTGSYTYFTGTSQATAYVAAVCGAIKYANPQWTPTQIKAAVLESVVTSTSYQGICVSGGRLNAVRAIARSFVQNPPMDTDGDQVPNMIEYLAGTLISDPGSTPVITHEILGGVFRISIPIVARPEAFLQVETSNNLDNWGTTGVTDFSVPGMLIGGTPLLPSTNSFLRIKAVPTPP